MNEIDKVTGPTGAIGVDIGGTKMAVAAVGRNGRIRARQTVATDAERGFGRAMERLSEGIERVVREAGWGAGEFSGIGIGCAGPVDPKRGTIHNPYTLPGWDNCDIVGALRERFKVRVRLENDADAALLGECFAGAGRGCDPLVMLTFGTGIGGAALAGGRIFRGVDGGHPEIGHVPVEPGGPVCYCGIAGCFEAIASGTAIGTAGRELGLANSREVFAAARNGHAGARGIIERALRATGTATWAVLHTLMPQRIVLGGGMIEEHYELFAAAVREQIRIATMLPAGKTDVAQATLGNEAGLVGAASLCWGNW